MTGTEMAIRLGISQQHYSRLENGYIKITVDQLIVISLILGVSPQSLIVGTKGTEMVINVSDKASGQLSEIIVLREKK